MLRSRTDCLCIVWGEMRDQGLLALPMLSLVLRELPQGAASIPVTAFIPVTIVLYYPIAAIAMASIGELGHMLY